MDQVAARGAARRHCLGTELETERRANIVKIEERPQSNKATKPGKEEEGEVRKKDLEKKRKGRRAKRWRSFGVGVDNKLKSPGKKNVWLSACSEARCYVVTTRHGVKVALLATIGVAGGQLFPSLVTFFAGSPSAKASEPSDLRLHCPSVRFQLTRYINFQNLVETRFSPSNDRSSLQTSGGPTAGLACLSIIISTPTTRDAVFRN